MDFAMRWNDGHLGPKYESLLEHPLVLDNILTPSQEILEAVSSSAKVLEPGHSHVNKPPRESTRPGHHVHLLPTERGSSCLEEL